MANEQYLNKVLHGDCLEWMKELEDKSVDMILCDLPYGTTRNKWDTNIPLAPLWEQYERIVKDNGAIVLTASQPFTTTLINSRKELFRYELIWEKSRPSDFPLARKRPLKYHENILLFYKKQPTYNPQMVQGERNHRTKPSRGKNNTIGETTREGKKWANTSDSKFPSSVVKVKSTDSTRNIHSTQKPVALFEWLIKTYTNEGDIVLDACIGSGTTAVAAINTNRQFIGIEKDSEYYLAASRRIDDVIRARG